MTRKSVVPLESRPDFGEVWHERQQSMDCTFFTSALWIGTWAKLLPDRRRAWLFELRDELGIQSLAVLVQSCDWIARVLPIRRLWLHATGRHPLDDLVIEFNGVPSTDAWRGRAEQSLLAALDSFPNRWDQLMIPHAAHAGRWIAAAEELGLSVRSVTHNCHYVDFDLVRSSGADFASHLPKKTRYLLRRGRREIEGQFGPISVDCPASSEQVVEFFDRMVHLHAQHWRGKGHAGAFGDRTIASFHYSLLQSPVGRGSCRVLRVRAGSTELGYLYLFVWKRVAYFYQSGINYDGIGRARSPGYVTIATALEHMLQTDVERFEFLAGDNLYKSRLATGSSQLHSLEIQRPTARNTVLNLGRQLRKFAGAERRRRMIEYVKSLVRARGRVHPSAIAAVASMVCC
ncbi:MAG: GNAT family N-acetyltransferase [Steroidobacteraceae bacterium]